MAWLKLHENIHIAVRAEIVSQGGAEDGELSDVVFPAKVGDLSSIERGIRHCSLLGRLLGVLHGQTIGMCHATSSGGRSNIPGDPDGVKESREPRAECRDQTIRQSGSQALRENRSAKMPERLSAMESGDGQGVRFARRAR
jgi:hypothetical protein